MNKVRIFFQQLHEWAEVANDWQKSPTAQPALRSRQLTAQNSASPNCKVYPSLAQASSRFHLGASSAPKTPAECRWSSSSIQARWMSMLQAPNLPLAKAASGTCREVCGYPFLSPMLSHPSNAFSFTPSADIFSRCCPSCNSYHGGCPCQKLFVEPLEESVRETRKASSHRSEGGKL
jgi:hypothetical protein